MISRMIMISRSYHDIMMQGHSIVGLLIGVAFRLCRRHSPKIQSPAGAAEDLEEKSPLDDGGCNPMTDRLEGVWAH